MADTAAPVVEAGQGPPLLLRRWWVVVLGVLLGLSAGQAFTALSTPSYSATTSVLVLPTRTTTTGASGGAPSDVNLNTESELVRSAQVAQIASTELGSNEPVESVLERLTVKIPPNSQVLVISYADRTAELAQRGTRAVAQAYLSSRQADVQADVERLTGALRSDLEFAEGQLRLNTDRAASLPTNSPDRVYAEAQRDILASQITNVNSRLTTLTASPDRTGVIITDAGRPTRASFPLPALNLAVGLLLGLLLGSALALLVDRLDHRLRRRSDVVRRLGLPVLADLGQGSATQPGVFDRLRNTIHGCTHTGAPVQVSDLSGTGASGTVALELARSWGRVNGATTLVLAHPGTRLTDELALQGRLGLSDLLKGSADLEHVQHDSPAHHGLLVVPPGREPEALEGLLQSPAAAAALSAIGRAATVVVLETASVGESVAAQALAAGSATTVLAVPVRSDERQIAHEVQGVKQVGGDVAGVVLVPRSRSARAASTSTSPLGPSAPAAVPAAEPGAPGWADGAEGRGAPPAPATGGAVTARRPPR